MPEYEAFNPFAGLPSPGQGGEYDDGSAQRQAAAQRAMGYEWVEGGEGGSYQYTGIGQPPVPAPAPAPSSWNTPGQHLKLDGQNSQWTYNGWRYAADFNYNGVPVVFVPREFIERGFVEGRKTTYSDKWGQIAEFMKPAVVDRTALAKSPTGFGQDNFWQEGQYYQAPTEGYIVPSEKFNAVIKNFLWVEGPKRSSGVFKGALQDFGNFVSGLPGPVKLAMSVAVPNAAAFFAGFNATQAIQQGEWGKAVVASLPLFVPSPSGQAPAISIPGMENAVGTLSKTLNVSAGTAGQILQGAVELAANGGDLKQVLQTRLAAYLGDKAGTFVSQFAKDFPIAGIDKLVKSVTTSSTKALLLNQDVSKAATAAFATEAIPLAFNSIPGYAAWAKQNPKVAEALNTTAINTAKTGDLYGSIRLATEQAAVKVIAPLAEAALAKEGVTLNDSQRKLLENTLTAAAQGKPLDSAFQTYALDTAKLAVKDQVAKAEGWESDAQKQGAKGQYGSAIKPDDYAARQQGWEDLAAKQAAIKSYGDTITPVGVKERTQVKGIDPKFDAEAYAKLNEVTGDPFQHFLTQGNKAKLPTNYESGADAALKSIGYKASPDEVKQVADLFKKSTDPDVALGKFYDEHWVTQEEAAAAAKQAGFELTPEQLKTFVGQSSAGQNLVLEDVARAANIGKESQQQRTKFVDSQIETVKQAYKDQGYSDAQINAAMPAIRNQVNVSLDKRTTQLSNYANQVKAAYGENSKEYAAAQKQLLETQAMMGGYGVIKEGDTLKSILSRTGESLLSAVIPSAQAAGSNIDRETALTKDQFSKLNLTLQSSDPKEFSGYVDSSGNRLSNEQAYSLIGKQPIFSNTSVITPDPNGFVKISQRKVDENAPPSTKPEVVSLSSELDKQQKDQQAIVEELKKSIVTSPVDTTVQNIIKAADAGRINQKEAEDALRNLGYTFKPEEAAALTGEKTSEKLAAEAAAYVDPRMVTEAEVRKAYQEAGLQAPTQADIKRFIGQRDQALLTPDIKTYLPTASANVITEQVSVLKAAQDAAAAKQAADQAAAKAAADQAAAKTAADKAAADQAAAKAAADQAAAKQAADQAAAAKQAADQAAAAKQTADMSAKLTATDKKLSDFAVQTGQTFADVKAGFDAAFKDAQAKGASKDEALQAGIDKVGQTAAANQKATDAQLGQLGVDVNAVKAGLGQLGASTTQQFGDVNARIDQLQKQGLTQGDATSQALRELSSGQTALGQQQAAQAAAAKEAADKAAAAQQATQTQFGDVNSRIVELMKQGKDYQTATTQAQTELKQGQAQLGTKVGELGTLLGGQIAGLGTQLTAAKQQTAQAQQQANMSTLFGLLGGFGGQQAPAPAPQPTPLANIGYVYDIGGKSIFANPQQEKAFVSPYAEGGTVEDLMKILRG